MRSIFVMILSLLFFNFTVKADEQDRPPVEITKASEIKSYYNSTASIGDLKQIEVISETGELVTYTISSNLNKMNFTAGQLSLGRRTKCDPYLGELSKSIVIHTSIQEIRSDWEEKILPLKKPLAIVIRIPAHFDVAGLCGEDSHELLGVEIYSNGIDPRGIKIWAEGEEEPAESAENAQKIAQYDATRLQVKELSAQLKQAIDRKDFQTARKVNAKFNTLGLLLESETNDFSKLLKTIPEAERPFNLSRDLHGNSSSKWNISTKNFQSTFNLDLYEITFDQLKTIATNFAKNPVIPEISESDFQKNTPAQNNISYNLEVILYNSLPHSKEGHLFYSSFLIQEIHSLLKVLESATKETSKNSILALAHAIESLGSNITYTSHYTKILTQENGQTAYHWDKNEVQTYLNLLGAMKQFKAVNPSIYNEIKENILSSFLFYLNLNTSFDKETNELFKKFELEK